VQQLSGKDRLIVALDVPTHAQAFELVNQLNNVSFFKIGLELFMAGDVLGFIKKLQDQRAADGGVFVDLKLAGDIPDSIAALVEACMALNVRFIRLVESVPLAITLQTLRAAKAARGSARDPKLLMVPLLSSLNTEDLREVGIETDLDTYILGRGLAMVDHGCDGLIVSGDAIKGCRDAFGPNVALVSPGIRPLWASSIGSHKRYTTPEQAIRLGADYLVVGKPITQNSDPRGAAERIIEEIDSALQEMKNSSSTGPELARKIG
jgi:orotidine-5'-phosphate decarboxylase